MILRFTQQISQINKTLFWMTTNKNIPINSKLPKHYPAMTSVYVFIEINNITGSSFNKYFVNSTYQKHT